VTTKRRKHVRIEGKITMLSYEAELSNEGGHFKSEMKQGYLIRDNSIMHLVCGVTSHNENDVKNRYCGHCGVFLEDPFELPGAPEAKP
jgi:hypothetical protein